MLIIGHELKDCQGMPRGDFSETEDMPFREMNFIFRRITVLREYLAWEMEIANLPFPFDLEVEILQNSIWKHWLISKCTLARYWRLGVHVFFRGIDDFLPHLPSLEIREDAIDRLINLGRILAMLEDALFSKYLRT